MKYAEWDRRGLKRRNCLVTAYLLVSGYAPIAGELRDLSPEGAQVDPIGIDPGALPQKLVLFLPGAGKLLPAEVRWRSADAVGVHFLAGAADRGAAEAAFPELLPLRLQAAELAPPRKPLRQRRIA